MKLTVLVDNNTLIDRYFLAEPGLSFHIEDGDYTVLFDTGLTVDRLGVASSYGAPAEAFEEVFEKGCNYFYLGSGRHRSGMKKATGTNLSLLYRPMPDSVS
ncbi:MAG: hypothetical protein L3J69_16655 [Desulfobacula sp.]|nr:hypothetical protein [Desulfobacula sp.]